MAHCLHAYMLAMDDYDHVVYAHSWAQSALLGKPRSLAINMVAALIQSQVEFDRDWCQNYQTVKIVGSNTELNKDFRRDNWKYF